MQAMEMLRSPGLPSFSVTTRRRLMPQGTSCSFLQAVTQALHSMQRSESQRNFIRAMSMPPCGSGGDSRELRWLPCGPARMGGAYGAPRSQPSGPPDLAERDLGLLHEGDRVVAVGGDGIGALAEHDRVGAGRVVFPPVLALPPAAEMVGHEGDTWADPVGDHRLDPDAAVALRPQ